MVFDGIAYNGLQLQEVGGLRSTKLVCLTTELDTKCNTDNYRDNLSH